MEKEDDLAFALSMANLGSGRVSLEEVQDESTVTLAQEIKRLAAKYGPERFTETSLGFKLAFVSAEVNVVVEVELDTMMYLEDDPPQFKVQSNGAHVGGADCRELRSLLEEYAEDWMVEEMPILERLMDAVRDWLFWKTEDAQFAPPAPAPRATSPGKAGASAAAGAGFSDHKEKKAKEEQKKQKAAAKPKPTPKPKPAPQRVAYTPVYQPPVYRPPPVYQTPWNYVAPRNPPPAPDMTAVRTRFEGLYGRPLSADFLETWNLPSYGAGAPPRDHNRDKFIDRPETECDEETLIKIEEAYVNENRILSITNKGVPALPIELMGRLTTLTELNLHNNKLSALPVTICQLSSLTKLYASFNQITEFPAELTVLPQLLNLDLSHNKLITMPPQVDQMTTLQILELNHNQIRGLPPQMGEMPSLRKLYLNNNKIMFVPTELGYLPKLTLLRLSHNPIKNLPVDEYQQGTAKTLEFLRTAGPGVETGRQLKNFAFVKEFSDVEFIVGSEVFPAHKVVLCARSPVLRVLLHSMSESESASGVVELRPPAELSHIPVDVFREFIGYLYRDTVEKDKLKEIGNDLEVVANYYGVERLEEMCKRLKFGYVVVRESTFAQDFGVLMEEPMRYSDVAFLVEGVPIKAHKVFLAASSEYFKGMFTSGLKEAQQDEIELPHVREPIFRAIREYCYTGDVEEITGDTAVDLLGASCAYTLPRLKMIVESLLGYSLDVDNVACLYPVAVMYEAQVLERACEFFMAQFLAQVKATEAWADLPPELKAKVEEQTIKWGLNKNKKW